MPMLRLCMILQSWCHSSSAAHLIRQESYYLDLTFQIVDSVEKLLYCSWKQMMQEPLVGCLGQVGQDLCPWMLTALTGTAGHLPDTATYQSIKHLTVTHWQQYVRHL